MLDAEHTRLFARLARSEPHLVRWLEQELSRQYDVLTQATQDAQIHRAQGCAQLLRTMLSTLERCKTKT